MTCGHEPLIAELRQALAMTEARAAAAEARAAAAEARAAAAEAKVAELATVIKELRTRLDKNSSNSSKPPSSDSPGATKRKKKPSGRKPGGQPGHRGHHRPFSEPDNIEPHFPDACEHCGTALGPGHDVASDDPTRHQVEELPPVKPEVTEHQMHARKCPNCGRKTRAMLPAGVPKGRFGPRLMAAIAMLSSKFRLTRRELRKVLWDLFGIRVSVGSVQNVDEKVSDSVAEPVEAIARVVHDQPVVNADETGYPHRAKKAWLWVATSPSATLFRLHGRRNIEALANLIPEEFGGLLVVDRLKTYERRRRSVCHAHLFRDWRGISERKHPEAKRIGKWAVAETERLLKYHAQFRAGELSKEGLMARMKMLKARYGRLLDQAMTCGDKKTEGMAAELNRQWTAIWAYLGVDGAEPTNNAAERKIRIAVLWRKGSFGTWSDAGQRFVERMLTIAATSGSVPVSSTTCRWPSQRVCFSKRSPPFTRGRRARSPRPRPERLPGRYRCTILDLGAECQFIDRRN